MQRYNILWADDEIDLLQPHMLFLQQRGYDITPVNNGSEAVELSEAKHFDVVFLDEHMPGMSGFEVQSVLVREKREIPMVVITGHDTVESRNRAHELGASAYLAKPVDHEALLAAIEGAMREIRL